jgi:hypothetical protein
MVGVGQGIGKWAWDGLAFGKMVLTIMMKCKYGLTAFDSMLMMWMM